MSSRQMAALALAAVSFTAAAGCGGSSKAESKTSVGSVPVTTVAGATTPASVTLPAVTVAVGSGRPLTRAQWLARGDRICRRYQTEIEALSVNSITELPRIMPQLAAYVRAKVTQLAKLVPPATKARDWQQFLNESLQVAEASAKLGEYKSPDVNFGLSPLLKAYLALRTNLVKVTKRDGFKVC